MGGVDRPFDTTGPSSYGQTADLPDIPDYTRPSRLENIIKRDTAIYIFSLFFDYVSTRTLRSFTHHRIGPSLDTLYTPTNVHGAGAVAFRGALRHLLCPAYEHLGVDTCAGKALPQSKAQTSRCRKVSCQSRATPLAVSQNDAIASRGQYLCSPTIRHH